MLFPNNYIKYNFYLLVYLTTKKLINKVLGDIIFLSNSLSKLSICDSSVIILFNIK